MLVRKLLLLTLVALVWLSWQPLGVTQAESLSSVVNNSGRALPVLDGATGQPIYLGNGPWLLQPGESIFSHEWQDGSRFVFNGIAYHYVGTVGSPFRFFLVPDWGVRSIQQQVSSRNPVPYERVVNNSGRPQPVLDGTTGQPVYIGNEPWTIAPGQAIFSHPYGNSARFEYNGITYHYIGSVGGSTFRFFLVRDWAAPSPSNVVNGWTGTIGISPSGTKLGDYFQRDNGRRYYGIESEDPGVQNRIKEFQWTGAQVRIWGRLIVGGHNAPVRNAIEVERIEPLSEPAAEPRDLTPFTTVDYPTRLLTGINASSTLPSDGGNYEAYNVGDGQLETTWCEGTAGDGVGQWVQLNWIRPFLGKVEIQRFALDAGFDKSEDLFYANNRVKKATITFSNGESRQLTFSDSRGLQTVPMDWWTPAVGTTNVKITIDEVYRGTRTNNTCLSEVQVWGRIKQ